MTIFDSLLSLYDKKTCDCHCCSSRWEVKELSNSATFRKLTFIKEGAVFGIIGDDFYKGLSKMTHERSSFLSDRNCDGVSFCEFNGKIHLLFVDLKSSFSKIEDAFKQDFFTLLKIHMFLSLCKGYDLSSIAIDFFAASPPCKDENEKSSILSNLQIAEEHGSVSNIDKCFLDYFFEGGSTLVRLKDFSFIKQQKLHETIMSSSIRLHIYTPSSYRESEGELNLDNYL